MEQKERLTSPKSAIPEDGNAPLDMKSLWERWDNAKQEESSSELVKGYNLLGVLLIITGSLFQILGSGFWKFRLGPVFILLGAAILAVKKFRALWLQKSLNR